MVPKTLEDKYWERTLLKCGLILPFNTAMGFCYAKGIYFNEANSMIHPFFQSQLISHFLSTVNGVSTDTLRNPHFVYKKITKTIPFVDEEKNRWALKSCEVDVLENIIEKSKTQTILENTAMYGATFVLGYYIGKLI